MLTTAGVWTHPTCSRLSTVSRANTRRPQPEHGSNRTSPQENTMRATSRPDDKARVGDAFPTLELTATSGQPVTVPDPAGEYVHIQLRRFAGCPICNLHLRSIVARHDEIRSHGIREVVVFHSTAAELAKYEAELPFPLIADPERELYRRLRVERRAGALLRTRA